MLWSTFEQMVAQLTQAFAGIQASEQKFLGLLNTLPVGILIHDPTGHLSFVNPAGVAILGLAAESLAVPNASTYPLYVPGTDQAYPADRLPALRVLQQRTVTVDEVEAQVDGHRVLLEMQAAPVTDGAGNLLYALTTFRDITEQRRADQLRAHYEQELEQQVAAQTLALKQSEARLKEAQRVAKVGSWEFDVATRRITCSEELIRILGTDPAHLEIAYNDFLTLLTPIDRVRLGDAVRAAIQTGTPYEIEHGILQPDGSRRCVISRGERLQATDGQSMKLVGTTADISDRKLTEIALRTSEQRFQEIAATISQFFFVRSAVNGQFLYVSPAYEQIWGRSCDSLYHDPQSWLENVYSEDRPLVNANLADQFQGQNVVREYRIVRSDSQIRWILAQINVVKDEAGKPERFVGFATDITARKTVEIELQQAKEAAEAANRAKSSFIANISHELRSPLNAILGFARLLQTSSLSQEQRENARIIERSGDHLLNIINQVLDLAKIEANRITLNPTEADLHSLLGDIQILFSLKAEDKGLHFTVDRPSNLPQRLQIDDIKLRQVLINLLDNAFKFTEQGQVKLTVSHQPVPNAAALLLNFEVQDTGPGIATAEQALLFEAFSQTQTGRQQQSGTGLGLAISREFVRLMGGTIGVESAPGQGSTFRFNILVQPTEAPPLLGADHRRRVVGLRPGQPRYRLLIVDDSAVNRRLLNHILSVLAVDIRQAENGEAAVRLWRHWQPHMIWMDLRMPVLDGYEATRQIRAQEQTLAAALPHRTVIVAVSATGLYDPTPESLEAEFDDFLQKPFKVPAIFEALKKHLNLQYQYAADFGSDDSTPSA